MLTDVVAANNRRHIYKNYLDAIGLTIGSTLIGAGIDLQLGIMIMPGIALFVISCGHWIGRNP